jgi:SAM-dependent methyltransferase
MDTASNALSMAAEVHHPLFARLFDRLSAHAEDAGQRDHRRELLAGLRGRVIEVGAGNGLNFKHYPADVTTVLAVEPEDYLRGRAIEAARRASVRIDVVDGLADRLPADDETLDAGVASLVLCSVPDQAQALAELFRVIRPGGELRYYEHVRAHDHRLARAQDLIVPAWRVVAGGCHPNRDTVRAIEAAGFVIEHQRRFSFRPCFVEIPVAPRVLGVGRRP